MKIIRSNGLEKELIPLAKTGQEGPIVKPVLYFIAIKIPSISCSGDMRGVKMNGYN